MQMSRTGWEWNSRGRQELWRAEGICPTTVPLYFFSLELSSSRSLQGCLLFLQDSLKYPITLLCFPPWYLSRSIKRTLFICLCVFCFVHLFEIQQTFNKHSINKALNEIKEQTKQRIQMFHQTKFVISCSKRLRLRCSFCSS